MLTDCLSGNRTWQEVCHFLALLSFLDSYRKTTSRIKTFFYFPLTRCTVCQDIFDDISKGVSFHENIRFQIGGHTLWQMNGTNYCLLPQHFTDFKRIILIIAGVADVLWNVLRSWAKCLREHSLVLAVSWHHACGCNSLSNRKRDATKQGAFTWQYVIKKRCFLPLFYHLKMVFWGLTSFIYTRKSTNIIRYITCIVNFYSFFITLPKAEDIIFCKKIGTKTKCNYSQVSIPFRDKKGDFNIFMILLNGRYL